MNMTDRLSSAWVQAISCCNEKFENDQVEATQKWRFLFFIIKFVANIRRWAQNVCNHLKKESLETILANPAAVYIINPDRIIPWGLQEPYGKLSTSKDDSNSVGDATVIYLFFSQLKASFTYYSTTFLCHTDFIPDRSCLDVPVGRKCSVCNGLTPRSLCVNWSIYLMSTLYFITSHLQQDNNTSKRQPM